MRPIKLELSGLNSYVEKQTINFEELTSRGLFGIFGNTGSGKSTILDAITIALYGTIARDTSDYVNSCCDKATVKYEFEIGSRNNRKRYYVNKKILFYEMSDKGNLYIEISGNGKDITNEIINELVNFTIEEKKY